MTYKINSIDLKWTKEKQIWKKDILNFLKKNKMNIIK